MKPRVLASAAGFRIVRLSSNYSFAVERADGKDLLGRTRWRCMSGDEMAANAGMLVHTFGRSLVLREQRRRR